MNDPKEMTLEEAREILAKHYEKMARFRAWVATQQREKRIDKIRKDPRAYLNRRKDYVELERNAERFGWEIDDLPKLNDL